MGSAGGGTGPSRGWPRRGGCEGENDQQVSGLKSVSRDALEVARLGDWALRTPCAPNQCEKDPSTRAPSRTQSQPVFRQPLRSRCQSLDSVGCVGVLSRHPIEWWHLNSASIPCNSRPASASRATWNHLCHLLWRATIRAEGSASRLPKFSNPRTFVLQIRCADRICRGISPMFVCS